MTEKLSTSISSSSGNPAFQNDRRRRDNINERIQELLDMIPEEYFDSYYAKNSEGGTPGNTPSGGSSSATTPAMPAIPNVSSTSAKGKGSGTRDGKPNKGQILTQTVEFITRLQNEVDARNREEVDLMAKVSSLSKKTGTIVNDINLEHTSAEVELSKIGVGPLVGMVHDQTLSENMEQQQQQQQQQQQSQHQSQYDYGGYSEYAT
ncbi:similar to Saccharomyces cerevisiae YOL067C RTG1 Transcription factor (bHLH) involved in interorganelle communication between mitochondria, peroxisomes, and nucleus [Maudiozyma barnettii]|uniref:Similar to Saccharomyces cerevisiae YOL067C RTG1 Transcription factor (BHLH) involved in interorganelle communication between mitochondria, peroxisomes, and nucleus n=1 Tax=Maudiozyma barnettii TaxID=61262 RepID=A0A8H2VE35_9SACH|nr:Rtg1p [Kazachstania barnettii]CAB4253201.1 similar to Saccharomyces cerevisiae YOL067C RTG1 Transcription factor (bHLH) involved in interorganelle communication between mitochondria, peroxisomes, and nucleus [Kazachstania barnettii]CAD1780263.1 similar to Saccharomyces cerevisiae YOL067C RTG1 Transcription factor (bHLH) involved in interorganelle communication between mitochondria, peroxisomes, and nucleus [Kazachstania barnettii]